MTDLPDLRRLVDDLGPVLVVGTSGDLAQPVTGLMVSEPQHGIVPTQGALVLAVGHSPEDPGFHELCATAALSGAAGVMVKGSDALTVPGLAVIVLEAAADWAQLIGLVRSAVAPQTQQSSDSLFDLAEAVAALCGGAVVLHDSAWQLLAYSRGQPQEQTRNETLLGREAPRAALVELRKHGVLDRLARGEVVHIKNGDIDDLTERYAIGVRVGTDFVGSFWALPSPAVSAEEAMQGLRRAAEIAALPLLRHAGAGIGHVTDAAFASLLSGGRTDRAVAERLGVLTDAGFVLVALQPLEGSEADRMAGTRRLQALANSYLEAFRVRATTAPLASALYLLLASDSSRTAARKTVTDLSARLQSSVPHRTLLSGVFVQLTDAAATRVLVDDLLDLAARRDWIGVIDSEAVYATWQLERFREVALAHPELLDGPVMRLVEHDGGQAGEFIKTLRAWFEAVGDTRRAADQLGLHVNTVRYRVRRASEISGLNLDNADERLLLELQVRLLLA